jgi:hypothetical protein
MRPARNLRVVEVAESRTVIEMVMAVTKAKAVPIDIGATTLDKSGQD